MRDIIENTKHHIEEILTKSEKSIRNISDNCFIHKPTSEKSNISNKSKTIKISIYYPNEKFPMNHKDKKITMIDKNIIINDFQNDPSTKQEIIFKNFESCKKLNGEKLSTSLIDIKNDNVFVDDNLNNDKKIDFSLDNKSFDNFNNGSSYLFPNTNNSFEFKKEDLPKNIISIPTPAKHTSFSKVFSQSISPDKKSIDFDNSIPSIQKVDLDSKKSEEKIRKTLLKVDYYLNNQKTQQKNKTNNEKTTLKKLEKTKNAANKPKSQTKDKTYLENNNNINSLIELKEKIANSKIKNQKWKKF